MPDKPDYKEFMNYTYKDRGGYKMATQIFGAQLPYELKLHNYSETFRVSRTTATRHYGAFRASRGMR
jgi:hypothetical protein